MSDICIKLDRSSYAHKFEINQLIHIVEFEQIKKVINGQIDKIKNRSESTSLENELPHYHHAISIFGERGTGKTSFLCTVLDYYQKERGNTIELLGLIDPTLLEEKAHIFLLVIALINEKVTRRLKEKECELGVQYVNERIDWHDRLMKLAKGLPSLDQIGSDYKGENWQSAEYIMEKGLEDMSAAFNLNKNFNELIKAALKILDKKMFMIAFDDIDINFEKGWRVLETIRKHLTSDRFIILMSGNLSLYNLNVRQQQWKQLGIDDKQKAEYNSMIYQLENQYMLKVFKTHNRIHLNSLLYSMKWNNIQFRVKAEHDNLEEKGIIEVYSRILQDVGIRENMTAQLFIDYLLSLSIRSQLNFMKSNWDLDPIESKSFSVKRIDAFLSRMDGWNIDVNLILNNPKKLSMCILKYLLASKNFRDYYQLIPTSDNESINACSTGLTFLFAWYVKKNHFLIFDYLLRIGYVRNLIQAEADKEEINRFIDYASLKEDISLKNIMGLSMAYQLFSHKYSMNEHVFLRKINIQSYFDKVKETYETLQNKKEEMKQDISRKLGVNPIVNSLCMSVFNDAYFDYGKLNNIDSNITNDLYSIRRKFNKQRGSKEKIFSKVYKEYLSALIDYIFSLPFSNKKIAKAGSDQQILMRLPLCSLLNTSNNVNQLYYSVFILIAVVGQILKTLNGITDQKKGLNIIAQTLTDLGLMRNYSLPGNQEFEADSVLNDHNYNELTLSLTPSSPLVVKVWKWFDSHNEIVVPPYLLGRIATRYYYNVQKIHENNIGDQMHRSIVTLWSASFILECQEFYNNKLEQDINFINIEKSLTSDKDFVDNLCNVFNNNIYNTKFGYFGLTKMLINCPLLYAFVNTEFYDKIEKTLKGFEFDSDINVYSLLKQRSNKENEQ